MLKIVVSLLNFYSAVYAQERNRKDLYEHTVRSLLPKEKLYKEVCSEQSDIAPFNYPPHMELGLVKNDWDFIAPESCFNDLDSKKAPRSHSRFYIDELSQLKMNPLCVIEYKQLLDDCTDDDSRDKLDASRKEFHRVWSIFAKEFLNLYTNTFNNMVATGQIKSKITYDRFMKTDEFYNSLFRRNEAFIMQEISKKHGVGLSGESARDAIQKLLKYSALTMTPLGRIQLVTTSGNNEGLISTYNYLILDSQLADGTYTSRQMQLEILSKEKKGVVSGFVCDTSKWSPEFQSLDSFRKGRDNPGNWLSIKIETIYNPEYHKDPALMHFLSITDMTYNSNLIANLKNPILDSLLGPELGLGKITPRPFYDRSQRFDKEGHKPKQHPSAAHYEL